MQQITKNKFIAWTIKAVIAVLFGFSIYYQFQKKDVGTLLLSIKNDLTVGNYQLLGLVFLMMFLNWSIESLKWKLLINKMQTLKFIEAFKGVLCGVALGTFTPNRIGEFGGRILFLKSNYRIKGIVVTLIGSFGQIITTMVIGLTCFCLYLLFFADIKWIHAHEDLLLKSVVFFSAFGLVFTILFIYFNVSLLERILLKFRYLRKFKKYINIIAVYGYQDLFILLALSFFRYGVFALQFYILLIVFGVHVSFFPGMIMIGMIFFIQTLIPTFTLTEIGVRGQVSVFFLCYLTSKDNSLGIVYASISLWIINLIIPALFGAGFMLRKNIFYNEK